MAHYNHKYKQEVTRTSSQKHFLLYYICNRGRIKYWGIICRSAQALIIYTLVKLKTFSENLLRRPTNFNPLSVPIVDPYVNSLLALPCRKSLGILTLSTCLPKAETSFSTVSNSSSAGYRGKDLFSPFIRFSV